jgi:hypothetical protein
LRNANGAQQQQLQTDQNVEANAANSFFALLVKTMQSSLPFFLILDTLPGYHFPFPR